MNFVVIMNVVIKRVHCSFMLKFSDDLSSILTGLVIQAGFQVALKLKKKKKKNQKGPNS